MAANFTKTESGEYVAKLGRFTVIIWEQPPARYWRGPESALILETERRAYAIAFAGSHSSTAGTLAGAMDRAESEAIKMGARVNRCHIMTAEEVALEQEAQDAAKRDAIEADRRAAEAGLAGDLALDLLPELVAYGRAQGLLTGPLSRFA
jgi:hypothetical protein